MTEQTKALRNALNWNFEAVRTVGKVSGRMLKMPGKRRIDVVQSSRG